MKFKKVLTFFFVFLAGLALVGCTNNTTPTEALPTGTDGSDLEEVVKSAFLDSEILGLENNASLLEITEDFKVIIEIVGREIEWTSTHESVTFHGRNVLITRGEENLEVTLSATLKLENNEEVKRNFSIVIIKL